MEKPWTVFELLLKKLQEGADMGVYLNNKSAYTLYKNEIGRQYFVDKSMLLEELFPMVQTGNNHICITRPRRFDKSVMANMIAAFFSKGRQARDIFGTLKISGSKEYKKHINQYSVIQISMNELGGQCSTYQDYIGRIEKRLVRDLKNEYPQAQLYGDESVVTPDQREKLCTAFSGKNRRDAKIYRQDLRCRDQLFERGQKALL